MTNHRKHIASIALLGLVALTACDEPEPVQASSLEGPRATIVVRGEVCIDTFNDDKVVVGTTRACEAGETSRLGLVVSSHDDRIALVDMGNRRFLDIDPSTPGVTHLEVGRLPVSVAASPTGRVAYTLDQLDRTISVVDLLDIRVLETRYHLDDTPIAFDVAASGDIMTIAGVPSTVTIHPGTTCDGDCVVPEEDPVELLLGGTATDIEATLDGTRAFVTYRDLDLVTVIALTDEGLSDDGCQGRAQTPCVTAEVPLTYGCRDGIDNDGDGLTDRDDPQCLSPLGAEAPTDGGPGRALPTECNDGLDNDEDGDIDAFDPECIASGGLYETWDTDPIVTACNDGLDNDGDGLVDLGDDGCFTAAGRTEEVVASLGFDAVSVDEGGFVAWVLDTANSQVLLLDAKRLELIDVPKSSEPAYDEYVNRLGINVPASPISIEARLDGFYPTYGAGALYYPDGFYYRSAFSAWVGSDDGNAYNVVAATTFCRGASPETCHLLPEFPLEPQTEEGCVEVACLCTEGASCPCEDDEDFVARRQRCTPSGSPVLVNPIFDLNQSANTQARINGLGQCEIPGELVDNLKTFALQNAGAPDNPTSCTNELLPQPRSLSAPVITEETSPADVSLEEIDRADLLSRSVATFEFNAFEPDIRQPLFGTTSYASRITSETWTVEYEGALPRTRRTDWLLPVTTSTTEIDGEELETITLESSTDLCRAGAEVGDRFVLTTDPISRDECSEYDSDDSAFRSYTIVARDASSITIAAIDGLAPLPTRAPAGASGCYESGVSGEIRPVDDWVVTGDRTGFLSSLASRNGTCVDGRIAPEADGRVATGGEYHGPTLNFRIYEGFVSPERGLQFEFTSESGFAADRIRMGPDRSDTVGLLPYDIFFQPAQNLADYEFLIGTDPDTNFIYLRSVESELNDEELEFTTVIDLLD